ncbi:MAG: YncE family protein [Gemmatimonadaceae bacterium]
MPNHSLLNRGLGVHWLAGFCAVVACTASLPAPGAPTAGFAEATVAVGRAPHGIRFSSDGARAFVALSGDDSIAILDLQPLRVTGKRAAGKTPLDLVALDGGDWLVTQFRGDELIALEGSLRCNVGKGPSLFSPRTPGGKAYLVSEFADTLTVFDLARRAVIARHPTGRRPYPGDVTKDGARAFVPNRADGSGSVIDLRSGRPLATTLICEQPEGGALTEDDTWYVVACGGSGELAYINTKSFEVVTRVRDGLGARPFSVAMTLDGRFGLVNNAGDSTLSVLDVAERRIVGRLVVGQKPIVVRMHPDGRRAFVSNEDSGTVTVVRLPQ